MSAEVDEPFLERPLDAFISYPERWSIVFTVKGRYYFVKYPERKSTWDPSPELLEILKTLPPEFFSPNYILSPFKAEAHQPEKHPRSKKEFEALLEEKKDTLDPFASWESTKNVLQSDARFQSLPEKEAKRLFDSFCPQLGKAKKLKRQKL